MRFTSVSYKVLRYLGASRCSRFFARRLNQWRLIYRCGNRRRFQHSRRLFLQILFINSAPVRARVAFSAAVKPVAPVMFIPAWGKLLKEAMKARGELGDSD
ncbi:hypothetical protein [Dulcicalothrix desertica]|uniref:hypothetical protein n=1 Tax=Dulcicalothrix desertica TaxID=32056 RepID=UPI000F8EF46A|nr:hypothetical protein [Dulcicalothrix desertica]